MKRFKFLKKSKRIMVIMATGLITLSALVATTVSTMAWFSHLNPSLTGGVESDTTSFAIENVTGYKYEYTEYGSNKVDTDTGHVASVNIAGETLSNIDQDDTTTYDGPAHGYGYYIVGNATFKSDISSSGTAWTYSASQKMEDYTVNDNNVARIPSITLSAGAQFSFKWHHYDSTNSKIVDTEAELDYNWSQRDNHSHYSISDSKVSIVTAGTYSIYLQDDDGDKQDFEVYIAAVTPQSAKESVQADEEVKTASATRKMPGQGPKKAYGTSDYVYLDAGVWNADGAKFRIHVRWQTAEQDGQWSDYGVWQYGNVYKIKMPEYGNVQYLYIVRENPSDASVWDSAWREGQVNANSFIKITGWGSNHSASYDVVAGYNVTVNEYAGSTRATRTFRCHGTTSYSSFDSALNKYYGYSFSAYYTAASTGSQVTSTSSAATIYARYTTKTTKTLYFDAGSDHSTFSAPKAYIWDAGGNNGSYPGVAMTKASTTKLSVYGGYVWTVTAPADAKVIFNDGNGSSNNKTDDLDVSSVTDGSTCLLAYYHNDDKKWVSNWYTSRTLTTVDGATETEYYFYSGIDFTMPAVPSKSGYTSSTWNETKGGGGTSYTSSQANVNKTANLKVYALYTGYSITLNNQGATTPGATSTSATYYEALPSIASNKPAKTGYNFNGYYTDTDGGGTKYYNADGTSAVTQFTRTTGTLTLYAYWTPKTTTITFDMNGKEVVSNDGHDTGTTGTYASAMTAITPPECTNSNWSFVGYFDSSGNQYYKANGTSHANWDKEDDSITLYAHWTLVGFTAHFDGNNNTGGSAPSNGSVTVNSEYTFPAKPDGLVRTGYTFGGWNENASGTGTNYAAGSTKTWTEASQETVTFYAKWVPNTYTITFNVNGGNALTYSTTVVTYDSTYSAGKYSSETYWPGSPTRVGYTFSGWYTNGGSGTLIQGSDTVKITSNTTLTAIWTAKQSTLSFNANDGTGTPSTGTLPSTVDSAKAVYDDEMPALTSYTLARTGYIFGGWEDSSGNLYYKADGSSNRNWNKEDSSVTLYARWTAKTYQIQYNANGGTGGPMDNSNHTYDVAASLSSNGFTAPTGKHFASWNTQADGGGTSYTENQSVSNLTTTQGAVIKLYAIWATNTFTVTYDANNGGAGGSVSDQEFTYGTAQNLRANGFTAPNNTFSFAGWCVNANGTGTTYSAGQSVSNLTSTHEDTVTLYAKWTKSVTLNKADGTGGSDSVAVIYNGSYVAAITKPTKSGYKFSGYYNSSTQVYDGNGDLVTANQGTLLSVTSLTAQWAAVRDIYLTKDSSFTWEGFRTPYLHYWGGATGDIRSTYLFEGDDRHYYVFYDVPSSATGFIVCGCDPDQEGDPMKMGGSYQTTDITTLDASRNTIHLFKTDAGEAQQYKRTWSIDQMTIIAKGGTFNAVASGFVLTGNEEVVTPEWSYTDSYVFLDDAENLGKLANVHFNGGAQFIIYRYLTSSTSPVAIIPHPSLDANMSTAVMDRGSVYKVLGQAYAYCNTDYHAKDNPYRNIAITNSGSYAIFLNNQGLIYVYRLEMYLYIYRGASSTWDEPIALGFGSGTGNPYLAMYEAGIELTSQDSFLVLEVSPNAAAAYGFEKLAGLTRFGSQSEITSKNEDLPKSVTDCSEVHAVKLTKAGTYLFYLRDDNRNIELYDVPSKGDGYYITYSADNYGYRNSTKMLTVTTANADNLSVYRGFCIKGGESLELRSFFGYSNREYLTIGDTYSSFVQSFNTETGVLTFKSTAQGFFSFFITTTNTIFIAAEPIEEFFTLNSIDTASMATQQDVFNQKTSLVIGIEFTAVSAKPMSVSVALQKDKDGTDRMDYVNLTISEIRTTALDDPWNSMREDYYPSANETATYDTDAKRVAATTTSGVSFVQNQHYYVYVLIDYRWDATPGNWRDSKSWANMTVSIQQTA